MTSGVPTPLVSVVVVSYNNRAFIEDCLTCINGQTYGRIEIIIVDQQSTDGTLEVIRSTFPRVALVANQTNTGFARGMNQGIERAAGDYVLLLNSDLFLEPSYIERAVEQMESCRFDHVGMLGTLIYRYINGERTREIDSAGAMLVPYHTTVNGDLVETSGWVAMPGGAAMFMRREMLDEIRLPSGDYLDSTYFCYGEDIELALRAQLLGWRCLYVPVVAGWHMGGASANGESRFSNKPPALLVHALKNRYLTLITCYPLGLLVTTFPWHVITELGQLGVPLVRGRWKQLRCMTSAYWEVLRLLPAALRKRTWLQRQRRVSCAYLRSLFVSWGARRTLESLWQKA